MTGIYIATEGTTPATPAAGDRALYPKTDGWYDKDSAGAETKFATGTGTATGTNTGDNAVNTLYDADSDGIVDAAQTLVITVRNATGGALTKGQAVYISGATGQIPTITLAKADAEATSSKTLGLLAADLPNNTNGFAHIRGALVGVDTSAFIDGDILYLSAATAGALTTTRPPAPNHGVYMGVCAYSHAANGKINVNVINGYELDELHNVLIASIADNEVIQYDSASGTWKNRSTLAGLTLNSPTFVTPALGTPSSGVATNLTGTAAGLTAGNVTTNANLSGHITSVGNTASLGSFTVAQLNTAISDADVATGGGTATGTNTGDQTLPTRASLGLDTTDSPQFAGVNIGHASDTTLTRVSAGVVAIEGSNIVTAASLNGGTLPASVTTLAISTAIADNDSDTSGATTAFVQSQIANNNNPTAIAQSINMTAASSGSNGIAVADNANINFGTGNFTLHWESSLPDWTPSAVQYFYRRYLGSTGLIAYIDATTGRPALQLNASAYTSTASTGFTDGTHHDIDIVVTRESASVAGAIVFYVDGIQLGNSIAITAGVPSTVDVAEPAYILGSPSGRYAGTCKSSILYNRALTAAEVLALCRDGVAYADKWGSQINIGSGVNYDFSGANNWANANLTSYSETPTLSLAGTTSQYCSIIAGNGFGTTIGKKYRIDLTASSVTGSWLIRSQDVSQTIGTITTAGVTSFEFTATSTGGLRISCSADGAAEFTAINYVSIGAVLELIPEGIQPEPGQWLDSSTNKLHAMQPAAGSNITRKQDRFEVRWANTWAGTHEAQYVGGVNQAVLPSANIRIESITMRCSATGVNVILGDGSATSRWVASVALATYLDCTVANRNHDGTNRKVVIDPDANYTGTITTTVIGRILD